MGTWVHTYNVRNSLSNSPAFPNQKPQNTCGNQIQFPDFKKLRADTPPPKLNSLAVGANEKASNQQGIVAERKHYPQSDNWFPTQPSSTLNQPFLRLQFDYEVLTKSNPLSEDQMIIDAIRRWNWGPIIIIEPSRYHDALHIMRSDFLIIRIQTCVELKCKYLSKTPRSKYQKSCFKTLLENCPQWFKWWY
jgi:hypothetical protein